MRRRALGLVLGLFLAGGAQAANYRVGLSETGYIPFSFPKGAKESGIFLDVLNAVGKVTGDEFEPVYAPTSRLKALFEKRGIDIEPGINPAWRGDQAAISAYSQPFVDVVDVLLGTRGGLPKHKIPVGAVRAYTYPKLESRFKSGELKREDADNEVQLLSMLQRRHVDMILIGKVVALYFIKTTPEYHDFHIVEQVDSVPAMFRVHKSRADLLPRLDQALETMRKSGALEAIFKQHQ